MKSSMPLALRSLIGEKAAWRYESVHLRLSPQVVKKKSCNNERSDEK